MVKTWCSPGSRRAPGGSTASTTGAVAPSDEPSSIAAPVGSLVSATSSIASRPLGPSPSLSDPGVAARAAGVTSTATPLTVTSRTTTETTSELRVAANKISARQGGKHEQ